jgi:tRNA-Thr(GGU) m(6)t(6)A37 methyltransferase TsaA
METVRYTPIGIVRSPFTTLAGMPIQTVAARGVEATIEIEPAYAQGLKDLDGFSYLLILAHLHLMQGYHLEVTPFMDTQSHGVFATRSPRRPNPIGLSIVRLVRVDGRMLHIEEVDLVDGTPVLDIKPYVPTLDDRPAERTGWFANNVHKVYSLRADDRHNEQVA